MGSARLSCSDLIATGVIVGLVIGPPTLAWADAISITSQKMTMKNRNQRVVFEGKVVVIKEGLTLHADRVELLFHASNTGLLASGSSVQRRDISGMEAEGHVVIEQGIRRAKADRATYDPRAETIVLTGDPEASAAGDVIYGRRITVFLKEDRSLVEGSRMTIQPK